MKVYKEIYDLDDFEFWGQAVDTVNTLTDDAKATVFEAIEENYPDGIDETTLNDILAYDDDWIQELLGYDYNNYYSVDDMKEGQIDYIETLLKSTFKDYDEGDIESFAENIVENDDYDSYDDEMFEEEFIDAFGKEHALQVLADYVDSEWDEKRDYFVDNDMWDYYSSDKDNIKEFNEFLKNDEEYQEAMKESWKEIEEDDKRESKED